MIKLLARAIILLSVGFFILSPAKAQEILRHRNLFIQTGDLIFVGAKPDQLSGAINRVTQREENVAFDHVGLLEISDSQVFILHASPEKGSVREPLDSMALRAEAKGKKVVVYRLSPEVHPFVQDAIKTAKTLLGKPYNWSYVLNDTTLYCSDFVERAFRNAAIFRLEPMTFKDPKTGKIDPYWEEFYQKLEMEVPEGKPGCNPNGLASNPKLIKLGELEMN